MHEIIPAVLAHTEEEVREQIAALPSDVTFFHMDVLEEDLWTPVEKDFEVHLMVRDPDAIADRWIERGAKRLSMHSVGPSLAAHREKAEIGLAVVLQKNLEEVYPFLDFVDYVHLMSIAEIGEQGHTLDERIFDRIKSVREKFPRIPISVDGGINIMNYKRLLEAGANRLVVGSGFHDLWDSLKTK
jgi:ribulose-phosphate 3-epimerase